MDAAPAIDQLGFLTGFAPDITRLSSFTVASEGVLWALLARYGIQNLLDGSKPWRLGLAVIALTLGALGGFRSFIITVSLTFLLVFLLLVGVLDGALGAAPSRSSVAAFSTSPCSSSSLRE
jgi:hypothetical protein